MMSPSMRLTEVMASASLNGVASYVTAVNVADVLLV